jgi:thiamine pyrophosphokinase
VDTTFVIFTGGPPPHPAVAGALPHRRFVIAADSGLDHALALGIAVDLVVGDLDSVSDAALAEARSAGIPVERHPVAKDEIDLELAIDAALARGARRLAIVSGGAERLDHLLAGIHVLGHPRLAALGVIAWFGPAALTLVHGPGKASIAAAAGSLVTLLPLHGPATGITTDRLRFALSDDVLAPGAGRGVSNEVLASPASVTVDRGVLVIVQPYALGGAA